jgi:hypothetical protein
MKTLASVLFGAGVLAVATMGATQPASAGVGVYVGEPGFANVNSYRNYCSDPWYRHRYWDYCRRYYDDYDDSYYDDGYYDDGYYGDSSFFFFDDDRGFRHRRHHHDRDDWGDRGHHDRDGRGGGERHEHHEHGDRGGGERGEHHHHR